MKRVSIIGCGGSGKSHFSQRLADATGLPLVHLDKAYWQPGWAQPVVGEWEKKVEQLAAQPQWIMDGNYSNTHHLRFPQTDMIVWLDFPRWLCMYRILKRSLFSLGRVRRDMAQDCPERFDWVFIKYIWDFNRNSRPKIIAAIEKYGQGKPVIRIAGPWEVEAAFSQALALISGGGADRSDKA